MLPLVIDRVYHGNAHTRNMAVAPEEVNFATA
jgi:hypothetical protein